MKLTVLGKYGPFAPANGASSGYLISHKATNILLDCGSGVLSRLQNYCPLEQLCAVAISHFHSDHVADLALLRYAIAAIKAHGGWDRQPLWVFAPFLPDEEFAALQQDENLRVISMYDGAMGKLPFVTLKFHEMTHPIQSFAIEARADDGKVLFYTGDTNMNGRLAARCKDADVLLCDAGLLQADRGETPPHLTALEAGMIAKDACVKKLLLTHIYPRYDEKAVLKEAQSYCDGAQVARELEEIRI
jgi:ribonuclease BN (tRNA processing enzyme)